MGPIKHLGQLFGGVLPYDLFITLFVSANVSIIVAIAFRFSILKGYSRLLSSKIGIVTIGIIQMTAGWPVIVARHIAIGNPIANKNTVIQVKKTLYSQ
jgi:hypothetical protein